MKFKLIESRQNIHTFILAGQGILYSTFKLEDGNVQIVYLTNEEELIYNRKTQSINNLFATNDRFYFPAGKYPHFSEQLNYKLEKLKHLDFLVHGASENGIYSAVYDKNRKKKFKFIGNNFSWNLDFYPNYFKEINGSLICMGKRNRRDGPMYYYKVNIRTGNIEFEIPIEKEGEFFNPWGGPFLHTEGNLLYLRCHRYKVISYNMDTNKIDDFWEFDSDPKYYNNKIGSIGYYHDELDLETMKFTTVDMKPEFEKHIEYSPTWIESANHIADGIGFISALQNFDKFNARGKDFFLYVIDLSTQKIVWQHQVKNSWKKLEYDGNRIYLLGHQGTLNIFEKEN